MKYLLLHSSTKGSLGRKRSYILCLLIWLLTWSQERSGLCKCWVDEWLVQVIMKLYSGWKTRVNVNGMENYEFVVNEGIYQGSVLNPQLFIIVPEALSRVFRIRLPLRTSAHRWFGLHWRLFDKYDGVKELMRRYGIYRLNCLCKQCRQCTCVRERWLAMCNMQEGCRC